MLAKLDRRRLNAADEKEAGRCPGRLPCDGRTCGTKEESLVMVEFVLVKDGISPSIEWRTSGPGSPIRRE